jgi:hypothetical protein
MFSSYLIPFSKSSVLNGFSKGYSSKANEQFNLIYNISKLKNQYLELIDNIISISTVKYIYLQECFLYDHSGGLSSHTHMYTIQTISLLL